MQSIKLDAFQLRDRILAQENKDSARRAKIEELFEKYRNERHMPRTTTASPQKEIHAMIFDHAFGWERKPS